MSTVAQLFDAYCRATQEEVAIDRLLAARSQTSGQQKEALVVKEKEHDFSQLMAVRVAAASALSMCGVEVRLIPGTEQLLAAYIDKRPCTEDPSS